MLFLRELEFPPSLVIWDSIFAIDSKHLSLADYIFIALLGNLRSDILQMDNSDCLRLLMQPQDKLDPNEVLATALYLRSPEIFPRPDSMDNNTFEIVKYQMTNSAEKMRYSNNQQMSRSQDTSFNSIDSTPPHNKSSSSSTNLKNAFDIAKIAEKLEYAVTSNPPSQISAARPRKLVFDDEQMKLFSFMEIKHDDAKLEIYQNKVRQLF